MAYEPDGEPEFRPYVAPEESIPEFTAKAIVLGAIFGLLFGAATVYLALRAGLTVSASIPIAVLAIAVFKKVGKSTILENNIVQTIGSAGESIAAGVVFTVPAFIFLSGGANYFKYLQIFVLAIIGGILGVLMMVPLRRSLIVKEHKNLPYPEGTACADVLIAGERGGNLARKVFAGFGVALLYKVLLNVLGLWKETPNLIATGDKSVLPNATLNSDNTPEYLGVGYIIGPRIAAELFSGGVLAWMVLIPLIALFVPEVRRIADLHNLGFSDAWISSHNVATQIYQAYVRYIGAGAVACAGVMTLIKTLPTIVASFRDSIADLRSGGAGGSGRVRTENDMGIGFVVIGSIVLVVIMAILPQFPGTFPGTLVMSALIVIFGFFFVTVSSRIVGIIGTSSNPISGMTIATLMATCVIFVAIGWKGDVYQAVALSVGAVVCIAAANAGATSQDLKTGFLVGATPKRQQWGMIIGVVVSSTIIGVTLLVLDAAYAAKSGSAHGIGTTYLPAPQGTLMAVIIQGILAQKLPWAPVLIGVFLAFMAQLAGAHALSWAVGAYLPVSTTMPIWIGGMIKSFADKARGVKEESELGSGMLYSTGLVAGGSIAGVLIALLVAAGTRWQISGQPLDQFFNIGRNYFARMGIGGDVIGWAVFAVLCVLLFAQAKQKMEA
jgi:putative OPT family oligopeptide transporter